MELVKQQVPQKKANNDATHSTTTEITSVTKVRAIFVEHSLYTVIRCAFALIATNV